MSVSIRVARLKQQFEYLFPGRWLSTGQKTKFIPTGLDVIDKSPAKGLARQRITEWLGPVSSGKTTLLRAAVNHWLSSGLHVAYIDTTSRLIAGDWSDLTAEHSHTRLWFMRLAGAEDKRTSPHRASFIYAADQLIRSRSFDIIILDLGSTHLSDRACARLQQSLSRAKAALILVRDSTKSSANWGCHMRTGFAWTTDESTTAHRAPGSGSITTITPAVNCYLEKDGMSTSREITFTPHVSNRLFAHPPVPDRRARKA